jgi:hypothetical protein
MAVAQQNINITDLDNSSEKISSSHHTLALKHEQSTIACYRIEEARGGEGFVPTSISKSTNQSIAAGEGAQICTHTHSQAKTIYIPKLGFFQPKKKENRRTAKKSR